jgi:hypothetical protein
MEWLPIKPDPPVTRIVLIQDCDHGAALAAAIYRDVR